MLHSISWQEFISSVIVILCSYYALSFLLLYSKDIKQMFNQFKSGSALSETKQHQADSDESDNVMGEVKHNLLTHKNVPREEHVSAEEIFPSPLHEIEEAIESSSSILIGSVSDLLEEIKVLIKVVPTETKEERTSLFQTLLSRYPQLLATQYQHEITQHIWNLFKDAGEFNVTPNEINSWWPTDETK